MNENKEFIKQKKIICHHYHYYSNYNNKSCENVHHEITTSMIMGCWTVLKRILLTERGLWPSSSHSCAYVLHFYVSIYIIFVSIFDEFFNLFESYFLRVIRADKKCPFLEFFAYLRFISDYPNIQLPSVFFQTYRIHHKLIWSSSL